MACAIAIKYEIFTHPFSAVWVYWYCREASTAMIVTNMPYSWALIRRIFKLKAFFADQTGASQMQEGRVRALTGHSLGAVQGGDAKAIQESQASGKSRNMSWPFKKALIGHHSSGTSEGRILEEGRSQPTPDTLDKDISVEAGNASNSNSTAGSTTRPNGVSAAANAVDKLYRLDDDELERPEKEITERQYDG